MGYMQHIMSASTGSSFATIMLVLKATAEANASIVLLVFLGACFAFKGVFDSKGVSDMGKLVYHVSLPCLLFSKILYEFSIARLQLLWVLPLACLVHVVSGYFIGVVTGAALCVNKMERRVINASTMFGNVGALAIAVVDSLCHSKTLSDAVGSQGKCSSLGISYIAFYLITQNILMFTWGETLMHSADEDEEGQDKEEEDHQDQDLEENIMVGQSEEKPGDLLFKVSMSPVTMEESFNNELDRPSYSVRLGHGGLKHVQSYLALETDHCIVSESPTANFAESLRQMSSFLGKRNSKEDFARESLGKHGSIEDLKKETIGKYGSKEDSTKEIRSEKEPLLPKPEVPNKDDDSEHVNNMLQRSNTYFYHRKEKVQQKLKSCCTITSDALLSLAIRLIKTPALQAAASAMLLASIVPVKKLFIAEPGAASQPILYFVYDAVSKLGSAQVPVSMLMLSGTATLRYMTKLRKRAVKAVSIPSSNDLTTADGDHITPKPQDFAFSGRATFAILIGRPILMPLIGLFWFWLFKKFHMIPQLPGHTAILELVVLIESAVPTAQNVVMLLLVHGDLIKGEALAQIVLYQMAISIVTFTVACTFFQWLTIPT